MGRNRHNKHQGLKSTNRYSDKRKLDEADSDQPRQPSSNKTDDRVIVKENADFELYYKTQAILPDGDQWEEFMSAVKQPLQSSFRVTGSKSYALQLLEMIKNDYLQDLTRSAIEVEGEQFAAPKCLSWYPNELAWQLSYPRRAIRYHEKLKGLHSFLVSETESGNISRQEAVSMIPPLLLDVKPHHKVLDMCAAPGSKTAQLIEYLHADETKPIPEGFVIANDVDNKRCYLMVHQIKRIQSPCSLVMNHDASQFPSLKTIAENGQEVSLLYDRVLADVPCSGDGTIRKNPDIWHKWSPATALNLHIIQLRILRRGLELLAPGGKLVYSTCSFNPVENEAVIAHVLNECQGSVSLIDVSDELPALKRSPGISSWKVMTKKLQWYESMTEVPANFHTFIKESMFPPSNVSEIPLDRCLRIVPHHQDTGGFFVAVLTKTADLPWMVKEKDKEVTEKPSEGTKDTDTEANGGKREGDSTEGQQDGPPKKKAKKKQWQGFKEDPFIYLSPDDPAWLGVKEFYSVADSFDASGLLVRSEGGKKRTLYYTSAQVRRIVQTNEDRAKIVNTGVKILARSEHPMCPCTYRLVQDGIACLQPAIQERLLKITKADVITLLSEENPFNNKLTEEAKAKVEAIGVGSLLFQYDHLLSEESGETCCLYLCGWRGKVSSRVYVPKFERHHYLRLCGVDPGGLENRYLKSTEGAEGAARDERVEEVSHVEEVNRVEEVSRTEKDSPSEDTHDQKEPSTEIAKEEL